MVVLSDMAEQPDGDRPSSAIAETGRKTTDSPLTHGQRRAARMLALGRKVTEVARVLRVSPTTIFDWRREIPAFSVEIERWHREQEDAVRSALYDRFARMLDVLDGESTNGEASAMERIVAAKAVIEAVLKLHINTRNIAAKTKDTERSAEDLAADVRRALSDALGKIDPEAS